MKEMVDSREKTTEREKEKNAKPCNDKQVTVMPHQMTRGQRFLSEVVLFRQPSCLKSEVS